MVVQAPGNKVTLTDQYAKLLADQVFKRSSIRWNITYRTATATATATVASSCTPEIRLSASSLQEVAWGSNASEGYALTSSTCTGVTVVGVDQRGLLYGIGLL